MTHEQAEHPLIRIALVGNPNTGRTTLFNQLTGTIKATANYPRVTVGIHQEAIEREGWIIKIIDLPGIYSLSCRTEEEQLSRQFLFREQPDLIVNVVDMGNLERNLLLTTQLIEMGIPMLVVLNMYDEAMAKGIRLDPQAFSRVLGCPVVQTVARNGQGTETLLQEVLTFAESDRRQARAPIGYDDHLEEAILRITEAYSELQSHQYCSLAQSRWRSIKLLEGDATVLQQEGNHETLLHAVAKEQKILEQQHGEDAAMLLNNGRYGFVNGLLRETSQLDLDIALNRVDVTRVLDAVLLHRYLGLPVFLFFMWIMFETTFTLGAYPMDWIDAGVAWVSELLTSILPPGLYKDILVDGVVAGVGGTIVFLPNIVILFFFIAFLGDSGYLPRSAFLIDRIMHGFGLHGKAFIPMITGFGCNVPAIMATRTIDNEKDRLVAILVTPFMSCSARLPVFVLFSSAFFADNPGVMLFAMYLSSIALALVVAVVLSKLVIKGANTAPFLMELPPYRLPTFQSVIFHMSSNAGEFLKKVGGIIVIGSMIIWLLQNFPQDVPLSQDYAGQIQVLQSQPATPEALEQITTLRLAQDAETQHLRYLGRIGTAIEPIFGPLGFDLNSSIALLTGFLAKEVIVATFGVLNTRGKVKEDDEGLRDALAKSMSPVSAIAFMVFVLLYMPCFATLAVLYRETQSMKWTGFAVVLSLTLAYSLALGITVVGAIWT